MNKFKLISYTTEMKMDKFLEWHKLLTVHRVLKGTKYMWLMLLFSFANRSVRTYI